MPPTTHHPQLAVENRAAIRRFIEKHPAIYQRWLARRQATTAKQAALLQHIHRNKP